MGFLKVRETGNHTEKGLKVKDTKLVEKISWINERKPILQLFLEQSKSQWLKFDQ